MSHTDDEILLNLSEISIHNKKSTTETSIHTKKSNAEMSTDEIIIAKIV